MLALGKATWLLKQIFFIYQIFVEAGCHCRWLAYFGTVKIYSSGRDHSFSGQDHCESLPRWGITVMSQFPLPLEASFWTAFLEGRDLYKQAQRNIM